MRRRVGTVGALALAAGLACCGNPGDARESAGDKREWALLQTAELEVRNHRGPVEKFRNVDGYELMSVSRQEDGRTIWILLRPAHAPFYKQLPDGNYWIEEEEIQWLAGQGRISATVEAALRSHVRAR